MNKQVHKAEAFRKLHTKGDPVIIFNAWDGGSAKTIAECGAKAIATGDHPVGFAHGFSDDDFDHFTFDIYLRTIEEIATRIGDLPFSVDISNADGLQGEELKERVKIVINAGAVGINYEDRLPDSSGVQSIEEQVERIKVVRQAADEVGLPLFINARTDLIALADKSEHAQLIDQAAERASIYKEAGASGFFVPGLMDIELIKQLASKVELPLNIIRLPGAPSSQELTDAGVGRISYGPVPQLEMTEWLKGRAKAALNKEM